MGVHTRMLHHSSHVLSHVWLFATPWTVAHQAPQSMEFSRQEYWNGLPFPSPTCTMKWSEVTQSYPILFNPMDCSPPGSSVHGILQARILEWAAISFSRGSSWPRNQTHVFCIAGGFFTVWARKYVNQMTVREVKGCFPEKWHWTKFWTKKKQNKIKIKTNDLLKQ